MKIEPEKIKVELPFALQNPPGDALDIVEIVMAVEDDLGIKMSDRELDARAGSRGVQDIAQKLTVRHIQQFAGELHRKKLQKSPAKQTGSPAVQVK